VLLVVLVGVLLVVLLVVLVGVLQVVLLQRPLVHTRSLANVLQSSILATHWPVCYLAISAPMLSLLKQR